MTMFDDPNREAVGLPPIWTEEAPEGTTTQAQPEPAPQAPQPHFSEPDE